MNNLDLATDMAGESHKWQEDEHKKHYKKCPVKTIAHDHLDDATNNYQPGPNPELESDEQVKRLAAEILSNFDGLSSSQNPVHSETMRETINRMRFEKIVYGIEILNHGVVLEPATL